MNLGCWIPEYSLKTKTLYKYDPNNQIIEESIINSNNVTETKHLWKYDKNGIMIEWSEYNADNLVIGKNVMKYNSKNNIIEISSYVYYDIYLLILYFLHGVKKYKYEGFIERLQNCKKKWNKKLEKFADKKTTFRSQLRRGGSKFTYFQTIYSTEFEPILIKFINYKNYS